jgi:hypothetical protein
MNKIRHTFLCRSAAIAATFLATAILQCAFADEQLYFDVQEIAQWQNKSFNGESTYQLTQINNRKAVAASSQQSASARYHKNKIDLKTRYQTTAQKVATIMPQEFMSYLKQDLLFGRLPHSTTSGQTNALKVIIGTMPIPTR